jgi:hypothetical protein
MIVKLAFAALISGIAIPALAIHHLSPIDSRSSFTVPGADAALSAVAGVGHSGLGPFLSGLI